MGGARGVHARLLYVALPESMKQCVNDEEYAAFYAPVEIHSKRQSLPSPCQEVARC